MIALLAASAISLVALQASINAPRDAFKACLKEVSGKASNENVGADAYEAYVRNNCAPQLGAFKGAVVKFDMGNKMSRAASDEDARMMISDFVGSALENYKYRNPSNAAPAQEAIAPKTPTPKPPTPQPTFGRNPWSQTGTTARSASCTRHCVTSASPPAGSPATRQLTPQPIPRPGTSRGT